MKGTPEERLLARVTKTENCWLWTGSVQSAGYGQLGVGSRNCYLAHRLAYELWVGPIPEGLTIDHLCFNRRCVRPEHLEAVTRTVNTQRMFERKRSLAAQAALGGLVTP